VAFDSVSPEAEDVIHDLGVSLLERAYRYRVMVVGRPHPTLDAASALITSAGWDVVGASTPLEAIFALQNPRLDVRWMVVVAPLLHDPAELLAFAADAYPGTRRLLIVKAHDTVVAMRSLRHGLADACLLEPMRRSRIRRVLGEGPRNWQH
jgi:PleD family two-component response regulator